MAGMCLRVRETPWDNRWMRRSLVGIALGLATGAAVLALVTAAARRDDLLASCPDGTRSNPARTARILGELGRALERLTRHADAVRLAGAGWQSAAFCYADTSELREPARVVLDRRLGDREAAARAAHLLLHAHVAPPWPDAPQMGCPERVANALAAEARARALEAEVAAALGTRALPERAEAELAIAYAQRCRRERR
jgi:hypothetical protein